jgi:hypothetical protein
MVENRFHDDYDTRNSLIWSLYTHCYISISMKVSVLFTQSISPESAEELDWTSKKLLVFDMIFMTPFFDFAWPISLSVD